MDRNGIVLLSGGLDSATTLAIAIEKGYSPWCLTIDYGQRHASEIEFARYQASHFSVRQHKIVALDLRTFGGSALTSAMAVPDHDENCDTTIPSTYVPARNTIFLSLALAWAEVEEIPDIFIGINAVDYSGYPDCRPEYLESFERLANLATKAGVELRLRFRIHAPLLHLSKAEIIKTGHELGLDYALTHSCYNPDEAGNACGRCSSCCLRREGFIKAGIADPTRYSGTISSPAPDLSGSR